MKNLLFILALTFSYFFQISAQKDKLDQLFEKYQDTEGVTSIKIAKPMFSMLNKLNIADDELAQIKPLLSKINGLKILIVEKADAGSAKTLPFKKLESDIAMSLKNMKYEELITVHRKDSKIKFLSSDATNGILDNLLLSINAEGNTVLMMLDGKISMDDVNKLISEAEKSATRSSVVTENISSSGVTQVRKVAKFSGISVSNGIIVNFSQGNNQTVIVETDANLQQYVSTEVDNGTLIISINNPANKKLNFKKLLVTVEAPQLSAVRLASGAVLTTVNTVSANDFTATVSSGANLNANLQIKNTSSFDNSSGSSMRVHVNSNKVNLNGSSGSMAVFTGNTQTLMMNGSSAASCNAQDLVASNATLTASSGATVKANATETLTATATSGSSIHYKGSPAREHMTVKTSSGGSVKPLN